LEFKTSNWRLASTVSYFSVFLVIGISASWIGPALPNLTEHVHTGLGAISIIFSAQYMGSLIGIVFGGRVYDKIRGHPIMTVMLVLLAFSTALIALSNALWQLALIFLLLGFASGTIHVGGNTLLAWLHRKNVGPYMNGLHLFFGLGAILAPIMFVRLFMYGGSLRLPLWIFAIGLFLPGIWLLFLRSPEPEIPPENFTSGNGVRLLIVLVAAFFFMYVGAEISINGWLFTYSRQMNLTTEISGAYLTSVFWVFITLGRLVAIPLYSYVRSTTILVVDLVGCVASVSLILLAPDSTTTLWIGVAGAGLFMSSVFPTTLTLVEERIGTTGLRTSWFLVGASFGAMLFPWIIGQLFSFIGPIGLMVVVLLALLAAFGLILVIIRLLNRSEFV
jgi:FHS family Na+ dependent glucose MFS transporter 1